MKLLERTDELERLRRAFQQVIGGRGQSVFISGAAGMGKTALVRTFLADLEGPRLLLQGYCDSLFAARPLGPMFDIAPALGSEFVRLLKENPDRTQIFPAAIEAIEEQGKPVILFFEDIQWADTATLDFIRFLARRIAQVQCLFILSLRENELPEGHPYKLFLGELPPTDFEKITLAPLSRSTVDILASEAGRDGAEVFNLTGGIPYYVREVLASYHRGIPESVRDSIMSLYHRQTDNTRDLWDKVSVIPGRLDQEILRKIHPTFSRVVEFCFRAGVVIQDGMSISFKHELFRTAIEESLFPVRRQELNKLVMEAMLEATETEIPPAKIIHHARLARDTMRLQQLAPQAAQEASMLGSHREAAKFYKLALDHCAGLNKEQLAELYEKYSYECYLTNQIREAIHALEQAIICWPDENILRRGNAFRFLSRLHWFAGEIRIAETLGLKAVELCGGMPNSSELAMAYSNMSQLMMLNDNTELCLQWGEKAVTLARTINDREVLCHSYNNTGTALLKDPVRSADGDHFLRESLRIALEDGYHEHAGRAYTNLGYAHTQLRNFTIAEAILKEGIEYCDARDLHSWMYYMQSWLAYLYLETGRWEQAELLCRQLLQNTNQQPIVTTTVYAVQCTLLMRRTDESLEEYMTPAIQNALEIGELHRIVPVMKVVLEHAWLTGSDPGRQELFTLCLSKLRQVRNLVLNADIGYWLWKAKGVLLKDILEEAEAPNPDAHELALEYLEQIKEGSPYLQALSLAEGTGDEQREALVQLRELGAVTAAQRVEVQMRKDGVEHIPRGPRPSTVRNAAGLTQRQMHVLELLSAGMQNKEIADELYLSSKTVDHHISAILSKLDVNSRAKAVAKAIEMGVLNSSEGEKVRK